MVALLLCCALRSATANFIYKDFNETTGVWFVGSAATTSCGDDASRNYGDVHGDADQFNEDVIKERGETTDSVFESTVETHQQRFNEEIEASQAGFLHRPGTLSAPEKCSVRSRLTPSGPAKAGAMWYRDEVPVSNGFDTYFTFQMTDHSKECTLHKDQYFTQISYRSCSVHGGDGFALVIHNAEGSQREAEFQLGSNGGQMGFGGIPNSLAIAFDTWQNPGEDTLGVDHVSIQSMGSEPNDALEKGLLGKPRAHELADGQVHMARVKYFPELKPEYLDKLVASDSLIPYLLDNGEQKRVGTCLPPTCCGNLCGTLPLPLACFCLFLYLPLSLTHTLTLSLSSTSTPPTAGTLVVYMDEGIASDVPLLAMPINLSLLVKMPSDRAYVGFTSSTGRFYEKHDILSWVWCDQEPCDGPELADFDMHQTSKFTASGKRRFEPGPGYGGGTTDEGFPTKNQNPDTDAWYVPREHFSSTRTEGLAPDSNTQVPPDTNY